MSKLIRYLLVTAALYGPFVYAADPVTVNQSDRKTMYGTAAVRPTPEAFDLASRGMCYVATDTGTVTEWTGTAWITTATCPGSATTSTNNSAGQYADDADFTDGTSVGVLSQGVAESASPTAVTEGDVGAFAMTLNRALKSSLYTPNGDSAMDDTANGVKVKLVTPDGTDASSDADGVLVNLGANNDVTVTGSVTIAAAGKISTDNFASPSTGAFAAGDVVSDSASAPTANEITVCDATGNYGAITNIRLTSSVLSTLPGQFELWLFDNTYTPINDNAAWAPTDGEVLTLVTEPIPLTYYSAGTVNETYGADDIYRVFRCDTDDTELYWALVTRNAYNPGAAPTLTLRMSIVNP